MSSQDKPIEATEPELNATYALITVLHSLPYMQATIPDESLADFDPRDWVLVTHQDPKAQTTIIRIKRTGRGLGINDADH